MRRLLRLACVLILPSILLSACGAPDATQQFKSANQKFSVAWTRYFTGTRGETGLTDLGWIQGTSSTTQKTVNQWINRSSHLAAAISRYDVALGQLAAKTAFRSDIDALIRAGSKLVADLKDPADQGGTPSCDALGCLYAPLQNGNSWSQEWLTAREDETTVYADFGMANESGGPYASSN